MLNNTQFIDTQENSRTEHWYIRTRSRANGKYILSMEQNPPISIIYRQNQFHSIEGRENSTGEKNQERETGSFNP